MIGPDDSLYRRASNSPIDRETGKLAHIPIVRRHIANRLVELTASEALTNADLDPEFQRPVRARNPASLTSDGGGVRLLGDDASAKVEYVRLG